jgi:hypothetical protein
LSVQPYCSEKSNMPRRLTIRPLGDGEPFQFNEWGIPDFGADGLPQLPADDGAFRLIRWGVPNVPYDPSFYGSTMVTPSAPPIGGDTSTSGSFWDFLKALPLIGNTIASTATAINHPSYPSAYQSPPTAPGGGAVNPVPGGADYQSQQASGGAPPVAAPGAGITGWLSNPANLPLIAIGGVAVVALLSSGRR